jgi:uncharacterized membrane protein
MLPAGHEMSAPSIYRILRSADSLQSPDMRYLVALLALAGVVVSVMALRVHYSTETQPCSINEKWDCGIVNHSPFAEVAHVPVAAIGIAGYLLITGLSLTRRRWPLAVSAILGLAFSLYLTHIEKDVLQVWCVYCVSSLSIISVITLLSLLWATLPTMQRRRSMM